MIFTGIYFIALHYTRSGSSEVKVYQMNTGLSAYHFNKELSPLVETLGEPLLKTFGITHFGLIKVSDKQSMLRIANHDPWNKVFTQEEFYNDFELYNMSSVPINVVQKKLLTGDPVTKHEKILYEQNLWNFLLFYERSEHEGNFFFFGTDRDNTKVLEHYINYPELFNHFIHFFNEKMAPFLKMQAKSCIQLNYNPLMKIENKEPQAIIKKFFLETEISKFNLGNRFNNAQLSKRELECLSCLIHGQTTKEIAKVMQLSPRTIESFIDKIKFKTGISKKSVLVQKLHSIVPDLEYVQK